MNILIIRLSAIGDIFFCTSLLGGLKELYPGCQITWLTEPTGASILKGHPMVSRLLVLPRRDWVTDFKKVHWIQLLRSLKNFNGQLRKEHFDLVIDPQGLMKSAIWARRAHADLRVGINAREGSGLLYNEVLRVPKASRPIILSEYRQLMVRLGGGAEETRMHLHIDDASKLEAAHFLASSEVDSPIVFCPFTTRPQKHWFAESWARLGDLLQESGHGPVLILGGPGDGGASNTIASLMKTVPVIAAGEPRSIQFALAVIAQSRAVIGVDTGLTHAGIGLGRPTIGLFGSTKPYLETATPTARILYHEMECSPCHRRPTCEGRFDCMRRHTPESVMKNLLQVIQLSESPSPSWIS